MDHVEHLQVVGAGIDNINFRNSRFRPPKVRMCGTCPPNPNKSDVIWVDIFEIKIENPKNWNELESLLDKNILKYIYIDKHYNKFLKYALYKKSGFDDAFRAMKFLKPKLTEFDFAFTCGYFVDGTDEPDYDLVAQEIYREDIDCIHNDDGSVYTFEEEDLTI